MRVHHITPGHSDKNFGKSINQLIDKLPEDDWICLRDIDTMPLDHRKFFAQCEALAKSNEADIIGCMTNRIGIKYQQHNGEISENFDILHHLEIAEELYEKYGNQVEIVDNRVTLAGFFMLFSKQTWLKCGRFKEGAIQINGAFLDYIFSMAARRRGLRLGVAKGIYIFHLYRAWVQNTRHKNTRTEYQHLLS